MIEICQARFSYPEGDFALQVNSLSIPNGQRIGLIGPSGSGKTTLLHLIAGIFPAKSGRVIVAGTNLTELAESARRDFRISNVGLVFQDFALLEYLSVLENILLPYRINRSLRMGLGERERAKELAHRLGLGQMLARRPTQLSQGERQRVAICRALITHPKLLLADEPAANLDPVNSTRVLDALDEYAKEQDATLIVVTHDHASLSRFDEVIDVSSFCLVSETTPGEADRNA